MLTTGLCSLPSLAVCPTGACGGRGSSTGQRGLVLDEPGPLHPDDSWGGVPLEQWETFQEKNKSFLLV